MYAVIRTGGKQYTVRPGDKLRVEKLNRELGSEIELDEVLLIGGDNLQVGEPLLNGAKVTAVVTQQGKAPKVIVFKKKRRQGYRRLKGHRQLFTELFIKSIKSPSGEVTEAEGEAHVIDPAKRQERLAKRAAGGEKKVAKKAVKKAAPKAAKKTGAKKKTAGKKGGAKKTAKKKS